MPVSAYSASQCIHGASEYPQCQSVHTVHMVPMNAYGVSECIGVSACTRCSVRAYSAYGASQCIQCQWPPQNCCGGSPSTCILWSAGSAAATRLTPMSFSCPPAHRAHSASSACPGTAHCNCPGTAHCGCSGGMPTLQQPLNERLFNSCTSACRSPKAAIIAYRPSQCSVREACRRRGK